jgi:hypothetical protein
VFQGYSEVEVVVEVKLRSTVYTQKLTVTSPTSGGHTVGVVRSRIQATEFSFLVSPSWCQAPI